MRKVIFLGMAMAMSSMPAVSSAQSWGIAPHVGTLGVGFDVVVSPASRIGARGGFNFFPFDINVTSSDVEYSASPSSPVITGLLDLYVAGGLRISGGVLFSSDEIELLATPTASVEIGDETFVPNEIGTLTGTITRNTLSPYLGIGFGNAATSRVGFFFDLGAGYHGSPAIAVVADGPIASDPFFRNELDKEVQEIQDDIEGYRFYPVVSVGLSIGF
jgi:hypothetical protein